MTAPDTVYELVERFERDKAELKSARYDEPTVRIEYINPFFEALGWDVRAPAVRLADGVYAGGERRFIVEARKPAINLLQNPEPAFQLRRHTRSARLLASVLTDFEELAIYDGRVQPDQADSIRSCHTPASWCGRLPTPRSSRHLPDSFPHPRCVASPWATSQLARNMTHGAAGPAASAPTTAPTRSPNGRPAPV
jgi:hypothetical protein